MPAELIDSTKPPAVWFVGFGDSSLNFELVVWVQASAVRRPAGTTAALLWEIHSALDRNGIEVPFPQRDLHLRSFSGRKDDDAFDWIAGELAARRRGAGCGDGRITRLGRRI